MTRFHFSLEQALRYKERRERLAEIAQLRALAAKQTCLAEVTRWRLALDETALSLQRQMGGAFNLVIWLATVRKSEQLGKELQAAQDRALKAEEQFRDAVGRYKQAAREAEALRTLKQQQHQNFRDEAAKAEQIGLEAMALNRWHNSGDAEPERHEP